ncbi:MAG: SpoIID/LytB domain-containing protein [Phycisphaerae bacterium]
MLTVACCGVFVFACAGSDVLSEPSRDLAPPVRNVRVLIASDVKRIRFRADGAMSVVGDNATSFHSGAAGDWIVASRDAAGGIRLGEASRLPDGLTLQPEHTDYITVSVYGNGDWSPGSPYPGTLRLIAGEDGRLDLVNFVDVERYVACVVANEVWPTFDTEAYRAQAIAARTFVLYQMRRRSKAAFDVVATQASQVYRGIRADEVGRRATDAAEYTRGIVLTWHDGGKDRLFCAYYSAACGGMSQSAAIFGQEDDIKPLAGGVRCDYCKIAPGETYRWGPIRLSKKEVRSRLVSAYPKLASLGRIRNIEAIERTPSGRPVRLRITGASGESHDMLAERFRLAMGGNVIRSTDCKIRVTDRQVIFEDGRGFGHGLGLCQWGMQGQALQGKQAGEILRYYYPGSKLTRVY